jgi:hypothetical protein
MCRPEDIPAGKSCDLFACEVAEHIRLIMGLLRNIAFEREDYVSYDVTTVKCRATKQLIKLQSTTNFRVSKHND